jgi:hypothetical protein
MSAIRCTKCGATIFATDGKCYTCPPIAKPAESQAAGEDIELNRIGYNGSEFVDMPYGCLLDYDDTMRAIREARSSDRQQLAAAQARIASLTGELDACETHVKIKQERIDELTKENAEQSEEIVKFCGYADMHMKAIARVDVLEKALEGAKDALKKAGKSGWIEYGSRMVASCPICNTPRSLDGVIEHEPECSIRIAVSAINAALAATSASGSQPSREKEGDK